MTVFEGELDLVPELDGLTVREVESEAVFVGVINGVPLVEGEIVGETDGVGVIEGLTEFDGEFEGVTVDEREVVRDVLAVLVSDEPGDAVLVSVAEVLGVFVTVDETVGDTVCARAVPSSR